MLKKIGLLVFLSIAFFSSAYAGFYLAPSALYYDYFLSNNASSDGIAPQLAAGYGAVNNQWFYGAAEIFTTIKGYKLHNHTVNNVTVKPRYSFGISLLPGILFDPQIMGYARIGLIYTRFEQANTMRNSYQIGLGLQYHFADAWDVRGEYDYMQYNRLSNVGSPRAGQYLVGLVYHFSVQEGM